MKQMLVRLFLLAAVLLAPYGQALAHSGSPGDPVAIEDVDYEQKLNAKLPLDVLLRDETGKSVELGRYFGRKPVVLLFAYYDCPMLCTLVLNHLTDTLSKMSLSAGDQFEIVTVSIDPRETPELATQKKAAYIAQYSRPGAGEGWHFLTGDHEQIDRLAGAAGFHYVYDAKIDQYAHPTGIILLTPAGVISHYLLGIDYSPVDLRLGLVEASAGKVGSAVDQFFLLCYHYNPVQGKYSLAINNILRLAGLATVLVIGGMVLFFLARERRGKGVFPGKEVHT
jgi:protein SCO1/2